MGRRKRFPSAYQFRTVAKWPVYKSLEYVEKSPPTRSGKPGPPGGALVWKPPLDRVYDPLTDTSELWIDFANLKPKEKGEIENGEIVKFARKYGPLGLGRFISDYPSFAEYLLDWQREIIRLRVLCDVYFDLCEDRTIALANRFRSHPRSPGMVIYLYDRANSPKRYEEIMPSDKVGFGGQLSDEELINFGFGWEGIGDPGRPRETAMAFMADVIEERLYKHISPVIDTARKKPPMAALNIPSLLGAMCFQIWLALASEKTERVQPCINCGQLYLQVRANKIYCCDACGGAYRKKRKRARQKKEKEAGL